MKTFLTTLLFIFLSFTLLNCSRTTGNETDPEPQLHYEDEGSGETILFIHGSQEDYRVFLPQMEALKESYRVVTYSRRYNFPNRYVDDTSGRVIPGGRSFISENL